MSVTTSDLKALLDKLYRTLYELKGETMAAEYTIQELSSQPEDNETQINRIQGAVDSCNEYISKIEDHIYTVKKAIKIAEKGVDSTDVVW